MKSFDERYLDLKKSTGFKEACLYLDKELRLYRLFNKRKVTASYVLKHPCLHFICLFPTGFKLLFFANDLLDMIFLYMPRHRYLTIDFSTEEQFPNG